MKVEIFTDKGTTKLRLLEDISFNLHGTIQTIPATFESDGQSVPRLLWRLLDPPICSQTLEPSLIHDALYKYQWTTRKYADYLYLQLLKNNGYSLWKCWLVYVGLRLFGWLAWNQHRKNLI